MRNSNLDLAKAVACIGVIIMHCSFPGTSGKFVAYMFKFAVPLFFMVSGYFLFKPTMERGGKIKNLKRKAKHIFFILLSAEFLSAIYFIAKGLIVDGHYSFSVLTIPDVVEKCLAGTFFNGTLWFLYALFWSYLLILVYICVTPPKEILNYVVVGMIILIFHIVMRVAIRNTDFYEVSMFRNAIVYGMPFILIGYGIKVSEHTKWYKRISVTNPIVCFIIFIVGYIMSIVEYAITKTSLDIYIGTIFSAWAIFTFCVSSKKKIQNKILVFIGEKLSLYIYIVHLLVIETLGGLSDKAIYKWSMPLIAITISILVSFVYYRTKQIFAHNER